MALTGCASHESQVNDTYMYVPSRPTPPLPARDMAPPVPAALPAPTPAPVAMPAAPAPPLPPAGPTPLSPAKPAAGKTPGG